jgi:hypothetical protein
MPNTMTLISATTVGSGGTAGVTFSSIPQTYTDLLLKISYRSDRTSPNDYLRVKFNSATTGFIDRNINQSGGTSTASENNNATTYAFMYGLNGNTATASTFGSIDMYIPNYSTAMIKTWWSDSITANNATFTQSALTGGKWNDTAAITELYIASHDTAKIILEHSSIYLYGIKNS